MSGQAVVKVAANSEVEIPISLGDRILNVQRQFFHVGVAVEMVYNPPPLGQIIGRQQSGSWLPVSCGVPQ